MMLNSFFHMLIYHLYTLFSETSIHVFFLCSNWTVGLFTGEFWELFIYPNLLSHVFWKYCFPLSSLSFHSLNRVFVRSKVFNFDEVHFIIFFLLWSVLLVSSLTIFCPALNPKGVIMRYSYISPIDMVKYTDFWWLNETCIPAINPTYSWYRILLIYCWVLFTNILLGFLLLYAWGILVCSFLFLHVVFGFGISVKLA